MTLLRLSDNLITMKGLSYLVRAAQLGYIDKL